MQNVGCANVIVELYGVSELFADIDRDREHWREGDHVVSAILDWIGGEGFVKFFTEYNIEFDYQSASEFRARHLIKGISRALTRATGG